MNAAGLLRRLAPLAILAAAALCWWPLLALDLYGWDTYPLIAAGRFESLSEFGGNLAEELMEGNFPGGRYWRPLVHLSFGLDHAAWGLDPLGYRLTDLALVALGALAVHSLFRRLIASEAGALVAGLVFAAHPLHWELLPLPARRADALCALCTVLALRAAAGAARGRAPWVATWCGLALASKETGALAVPLCFALGWLLRGARASARSTWPAGLVLLVYLLLRTWVLGGLGGGPRSSLAGASQHVLGFAERYGILLAYPVPFLGALAPASVLLLVLALLLSCLGWLLSRRGGGQADALRALALAGLWLALALLMTCAAGVPRSWYAVAFLAPWSLCLGTFAALAVRASATGSVQLRWATLAALLAVLAAGLGGQVAGDSAAEKRSSAAAARELVQRFEAAVEAAAPGATITVDARPPEGAAVRHGEETQRPLTLPPYGLDAYAALRWPTRRVRCELERAAAVPPPAPDEVLVLLLSR